MTTETKHTPEQLLELIKVAATQFGRCCDLYQDSLGGFHCHGCGQATFRMLGDVQNIISLVPEVTHEEATSRAILQNAAPDMLIALKIAKADTELLLHGDLDSDFSENQKANFAATIKTLETAIQKAERN